MLEKHFHVQSFASQVILCNQSGVNVFHALLISSEIHFDIQYNCEYSCNIARSFLQKLKKAFGLTFEGFFFRTDRI